MSHILGKANIRLDLFEEFTTKSPLNDQIIIFAVFTGFKELDNVWMFKVLVDEDFLFDIVVWAGFGLSSGNGFDGHLLASTLINCLPDAKN